MYRSCKIRFERRTPKYLNKQKKTKTKQTPSPPPQKKVGWKEKENAHTPIFKSLLLEWGGGGCLEVSKLFHMFFPIFLLTLPKKVGGGCI